MKNNQKNNPQAEKDEDTVLDGYTQDSGEIPDTEKLKKQGIWRKIPAPFKVWFINAWFGAAVFFFLGWGVFHITIDQLDLVAALGLTYGIAGDIVMNNLFLTVLQPDEYPRSHFLYHTKSPLSVVINCLYGVALALTIALLYGGVNLMALSAGWVEKGGVWLGADPIIVGILYAVLNFTVVFCRNQILKIFKSKSKIPGNNNENK